VPWCRAGWLRVFVAMGWDVVACGLVACVCGDGLGRGGVRAGGVFLVLRCDAYHPPPPSPACAGFTPFSDMEEGSMGLLLAALVFRGTKGTSMRPDLGMLPHDTPATVRDMLQRAWAFHPSERPSSFEVANVLMTAAGVAATPSGITQKFIMPAEASTAPPPLPAPAPAPATHSDVPAKYLIAAGGPAPPGDFVPASTPAPASNPYAATPEGRAAERLDEALARTPIRVFIRAFGRDSLNPLPATHGSTILDVKRAAGAWEGGGGCGCLPPAAAVDLSCRRGSALLLTTF
jgi:hypothetical protein